MVKAAHAFAAAYLLANQQLSNRWVVIGQSQGGGAAIYTARYATQFGGPGLDYLGAVGTGVPAYIEDYLNLLGPNTPPVALTPDINSFFTYMLASIRQWRPQLGINKILTPYGQKYLALGEKLCIFTGMTSAMNGVVVGKYLTKPLTSLPHWTQTIDEYMKMPESGFDKPFFMGHGLLDTDVPYAATARCVAQLEANHQPVTFKTYPTDHSGALVQAQADEIPFVANLFNHAGTGPTPHLITRLALIGRPSLWTALRRGLTLRVITDARTRVKAVAWFKRQTIGTRTATSASTGIATVTIKRIRTAPEARATPPRAGHDHGRRRDAPHHPPRVNNQAVQRPTPRPVAAQRPLRRFRAGPRTARAPRGKDALSRDCVARGVPPSCPAWRSRQVSGPAPTQVRL